VNGGDVLVVVSEGLDHGIDISVIAGEGDLIEKSDVEGFKFLLHEAEDIIFGDRGGDGADEAELKAEQLLGFAESPFGVLELVAVAAEFFDGVVKEGEEGLLFLRGEFVAHDFIDKVTESARGVVNDVAELAVIAMDITDDVDAAFG